MWSKIIEFSLKYKLLVIIVAIAVTILGWQTFQSAPIDVYPDINPPRITVLTEAHGWSPEEMERSEEHTSEHQSLVNLVCRLLLEKKNIKKKIN